MAPPIAFNIFVRIVVTFRGVAGFHNARMFCIATNVNVVCTCSRNVHIPFRARIYAHHMKRLLALIPAAALTLIFAAASVPATAANAPQVFTINASSTALFTPDAITVKVGQPVELKLVGKDGVHEIASKALGIPSTMITPDSTKTVTFTPTKAGTYTLHCLIPCGLSHAKMEVTINVV